MAKPARTMAKATAAQRKLVRKLRTVREVNGVGITRVEAGFCLKVNLSVRPRAGVPVPEEIDGVPVRVEVVGRIRARRPA